ncbi:MAG: class D beta-lactamase [Chlamydiia bacterium]|nr:class D beta-lactamase [Chlamydiia bacterium]
MLIPIRRIDILPKVFFNDQFWRTMIPYLILAILGFVAALEQSTLLIVRLEDGQTWVTNPCRAEQRFLPASTAKVAHTFIALEEGVASGPDCRFPWDGVVRELEPWNSDQTLASAYRFSALWVYQQITQRLGHAKLQRWMRALEYGNVDIGSPEDITSYWLEGPLAISAKEQVQFLTRLVREEYAFSPETYAHGKEIMMEESGADWTLYAKSGFSGDVGWYVGWYEILEGEQTRTYLFAFNMDIVSREQLWLRKASVMHGLGIIEPSVTTRAAR